ncbi:MAG: glycosyltransferase [Bacteroidales bacterium]|nr:MAG: glycosyltransferase [Bacteroidales bacterium]
MREIISNSTVYELILVPVLIATLIIQLYYYLGIYLKVALHKNIGEDLPTPCIPISVVICARDEEANLESFLPYVLEQDYPDFEVIVVNDCSSDNSSYTLDRMLKKYPNLRVTTIKQDEKFTHNKKLALTVGIKAAKNEWLVLTDADCRPDSSKWLASMATNFSENSEVVLGYGGFFEERGFLNRIIRFDGLFIAMQYLGFALIGRPYIGVGRNLAYKKDLFFRNKGFASHAHIHSGDDDLFINAVAKRTNTKVEFRIDSHTRTTPRNSYNKWEIQKRRHITTSSRYRLSTKIILGGEILSRIFFFGSAIALIAMLYYPWIVASSILLRWIVQLSIIKGVMNRLSERKILLLSLFYDFYSLFFYARLSLLNVINPRKASWR